MGQTKRVRVTSGRCCIKMEASNADDTAPPPAEVPTPDAQPQEASIDNPPDVPPSTEAPPPEAKVVDKQAVLAKLREILGTVDLDVTTEKMLRKLLEQEFGVDLMHLKADIRQEIETWMDAHAPAEEEPEEEPAPVKKRRAGGGFSKLTKLSPALSELLGVKEESRAQVVKKIWEYIREHNLQDPKDKRKIKADEKMRKVFPATMTMFSMNKHLNKHFYADDGMPVKRQKVTDEDEEDEEDDDEGDDDDEGSKKASKSKKASSSKGKKKQKRGSDDDNDDDEDDDGDEDDAYVPRKTVKAKKPAGSKSGGGGGFTKLMKLSEPLAGLTGEESMSRPQLQKFFTAYFKDNNLLDPKDKRIVLCNDKLKEMFQVDSFRAFGQIQKLLSPHLS